MNEPGARTADGTEPVDRAEAPGRLLDEGRFFSDVGRLQTAEAMVRQALNSGADPGEAHALLALTAVREGRWRTAETELERATDAGCSQPWLEQMAGRIHYRRGRPEQALAAFRRALELDPASVEATYDCCCAELGHGDGRVAAALAARMESVAPGHPRTRRAAALLALADGDWAHAERLLAPSVDSTDVEALNNFSLSLIAQGRVMQARAALRRALDAGERTSYWADLQPNRRLLTRQTLRGLESDREVHRDRVILAQGGARPIVFLGLIIVTALLVRQTFLLHPLAGAGSLALLLTAGLVFVIVAPGRYRALPLVSEVRVQRRRGRRHRRTPAGRRRSR